MENNIKSRNLPIRCCLAFILALIIAGGVIAFGYIFTNSWEKEEQKDVQVNYQEKLDPEDVHKSLPPSNTILGNYKQAAVVSNGFLCPKIGIDILLRNGSAVEAAIATALCDGVMRMMSMGIGGGFLMTIYKRSSKTASALIARETAPAAASENMYHSNELASKIGARSAGIPGELKGYQAAFEKYRSGNLEWKDLFEPTIKLCEEGIPVDEFFARNLLLFEKDIRISGTLSNVLVREDGTLPKLNETIKRPILAKTLRAVAYSPNMAGELYNGSLTDGFVKDIKNGGGIITKEDLANYRVQWAEPIETNLSNNLKLYSMPPPGSGALLAFMLRVLDGFVPAPMNQDSLNYQRITETFKYTYGRRTEFADPQFVNVSELLKELSSEDYINSIRHKISDKFTSQDYKYYGAKFDLTEDHGTANIVVLAPNGDAVCITSTVNNVFGSKFLSRSTGILLNNQMDDFSAPDIINSFGVPPSPINFIVPGKRPMSSMSPTVIVDENGDVRLVIGSAGGTKITTSIAFVTALHLWFGKDIKQAVDEPRIHHQLMPMKFMYEYGVLKEIVEKMQKIGHKIFRIDPDSSSCVTAIAQQLGEVTGNCDYRWGGGSVDGF